MKTLSLIVPAYNESENIQPFYDRVCDVFSKGDKIVEVVFVDDGSRDDTYEKIAALRTRPGSHIAVKGLSFSRNFGKEAAMLAGLEHATGDYFAFIDADLQQDPVYVRQMAEMLDRNPDIDVVAAYQRERKEGKVQSFLKSCFYKVINRLSDVHFEDKVSDFRTFRRSVRDAMLAITESNRFSKGIFAWVGFKTATIPYDVKARQHGRSSWSLGKLFRYAADGIAGYSSAGLKLPFFAGGVLFAVSLLWLILGSVFAVGRLMTLLPFLILLLSALQMTAIGLIGDTLGRTYTEVRHRPAYIVRKTCDLDAENYDKIKDMIPLSNGKKWRKHA